jgi:hypothetical protein
MGPEDVPLGQPCDDVEAGVAHDLENGLRQPVAPGLPEPFLGELGVAESGCPDPRQLGVQRVGLVVALGPPAGNEDRLPAQTVEERRVPHVAVEVAHVETVQADDYEVHSSPA